MTGDKPGLEQLQQDLTEHVIVPVCEEAKSEPDADTRVFVSPEGALIGGGPAYPGALPREERRPTPTASTCATAGPH